MRKTDEKRSYDYLALLRMFAKTDMLAEKIAKKLAKREELKAAGLDEKAIKLYLRVPCVYCPYIHECYPNSSILSPFVCRNMDITVIHQGKALRKSINRLANAGIELTPQLIRTLRDELLVMRLPGRLRVIYNYLLLEERMGFYEYFTRLAPKAYWDRLTRPLRPTIRITWKAPDNIIERLEAYGYQLKQVPRYERGFWILSGDQERIGNLLEYALGYLYLQEAASMIPPVVLKPQKGERILDLCAAPGSKTTQMADMIENDGIIIANDVNPHRLRMLGSNVQRTSSYSVIVTRFDGRRLPKALRKKFDAVLVDAPCSALGTARRFPENVEKRTLEFTLRISRLQYELLRSAVFAVRPGGRIVYSTCTLTVEENELIVDRILKEFPNVDVESIDVPGLKYSPGLTRRQDMEFDERLSKTARIYPRENDTEGFYVALLRVERSVW